MAIYRLEAKVISRGGGRSTVASASYRSGKCVTSAAAYRAGGKLTDERTGQSYDYTRKDGVLGAEIMLPAGAPAWMNDRARLWNAVEATEKRKDAQLAKDFILALPHELTHEQRVALTRDFVRQQFTDKGYAADIAWHAPSREDSLNFHAHVMVTMRRVEGEGFARCKERPATADHPLKHWKQELGALREAWATTTNTHLAAAGHEARVDARSLEAQGIDREAEPKLGPIAAQIELQGRESHAGNDRRAVRARNAERLQLVQELARAAANEARILLRMDYRRAGEGHEDHRPSEREAPWIIQRHNPGAEQAGVAAGTAAHAVGGIANAAGSLLDGFASLFERSFGGQAQADHAPYIEAQRGPRDDQEAAVHREEEGRKQTHDELMRKYGGGEFPPERTLDPDISLDLNLDLDRGRERTRER